MIAEKNEFFWSGNRPENREIFRLPQSSLLRVDKPLVCQRIEKRFIVQMNRFSVWNYLLKVSSFSLPSLFATMMAATESPVQFRLVTSISIGRLMARISV